MDPDAQREEEPVTADERPSRAAAEAPALELAEQLDAAAAELAEHQARASARLAPGASAQVLTQDQRDAAIAERDRQIAARPKQQPPSHRLAPGATVRRIEKRAPTGRARGATVVHVQAGTQPRPRYVQHINRRVRVVNPGTGAAAKTEDEAS